MANIWQNTLLDAFSWQIKYFYFDQISLKFVPVGYVTLSHLP